MITLRCLQSLHFGDPERRASHFLSPGVLPHLAEEVAGGGDPLVEGFEFDHGDAVGEWDVGVVAAVSAGWSCGYFAPGTLLRMVSRAVSRAFAISSGPGSPCMKGLTKSA